MLRETRPRGGSRPSSAGRVRPTLDNRGGGRPSGAWQARPTLDDRGSSRPSSAGTARPTLGDRGGSRPSSAGRVRISSDDAADAAVAAIRAAARVPPAGRAAAAVKQLRDAGGGEDGPSSPAAASRFGGEGSEPGEDYQLHLDVKETLSLEAGYPGEGLTMPVAMPVSRKPRAGPTHNTCQRQRPASAPPRIRQRSKMSTGAPRSSVAEATTSASRANTLAKAHLKDQRLMLEARAAARSVSAERGNSSLYRHLCHMSEANALAEDLGIRTRFRPHRKDTGNVGGEEVVCRIFEDGELATEVPLPFFERRFKALQARWNELMVTKADKPAAKGSSARAAARTGTQVPYAGEAGDLLTVPAPGGRETSATRPSTSLSQDAQDALQRELKKVTMETLALAERMWQQAEALEQERSRGNRSSEQHGLRQLL